MKSYILKWINRAAAPLGLHVVEKQASRGDQKGNFVLYQYLDSSGSFDYQKYVKIQQKGNLAKIDLTWVSERNVQFLCEWISAHSSRVERGICHGTRRGNEQKWFSKYLECEVIGTEISETATSFPNTIQWDFNVFNPDWSEKFDFVYSNSFDHSYDPEKCIRNWMSSLRSGGFCFIEHSTLHGPVGANELDPFGAEMEWMPFLFTKWTDGSFFVREILQMPHVRENVDAHVVFVLEKR